MANLIGKTLSNRYRIDSDLGKGGMAEVYKAWDTKRFTYLALKVLRQDLSQDRVFLRRFRAEAQTLEALQHPNIVRYYGIETDGMIVYILMEYIEGTTLQSEIFRARGKPLNEAFVTHVMRSVCSALHFAHQQNHVHCDIKPANIMINEAGEVKLTDFGIARMTDAATMTMVGFGTPAYMAPEMVRGELPSIQSDIYSLGIVLYEMVTGGERPFTGDHAQVTGTTGARVRWEQVNLTPPSPRRYNPSLSPKIEALIMKCLEKNPANRYQKALELLNAMELSLIAPEGVSNPAKKQPPAFQPANPPVFNPQNNPPQPQKRTGFPVWAYLGIGIAVIVLTIGVGSAISGGRGANIPQVTPISQQTHEEEQIAGADVLPVAQESEPSLQAPDGNPTYPPAATQPPTKTSAPTQTRAATSTKQPTTVTSGYITPTPKLFWPLPNCAASHLHIGDSAFVSYDGGTNKLRSDPDTHPTDNIIGEIQPGEVLEIVGGPVCNYGWILWEVRTTRDKTGWTPESDGEEFWILPLTTRQICTGALPTRLVEGKKAKVMEEPNLANFIRKEPSLSGEIIGKIQPGDWMTVLEGPRCANNANWWRVESIPPGLTGWTMEGKDSTYYLAPQP